MEFKMVIFLVCQAVTEPLKRKQVEKLLDNPSESIPAPLGRLNDTELFFP